ncbi:hypothetical protein SIAM614_29861 [Stappia aggregata IAM 12614]|uniref:Uncharacterized protein n=2 Tax=Roseibium aggregatum TaxID=187304 RepID=A0P1U4_ROSAI|nr:hypothetical protein SIAM614_29861 [Stappia aggregata IAM 12614] [Roseibium aggregatum IAM 12614]
MIMAVCEFLLSLGLATGSCSGEGDREVKVVTMPPVIIEKEVEKPVVVVKDIAPPKAPIPALSSPGKASGSSDYVIDVVDGRMRVRFRDTTFIVDGAKPLITLKPGHVSVQYGED